MKRIVFSAVIFSNLLLAQDKKQVLFSNKNQNAVACYRIPSIVKSHDNTLVAVIDERHNSCADLIGNTNINIAMRSSRDGGATWSAAKTVIDLPEGQSASDPSMVLDRKTKEIFMFYNYMDHNTPGKEFRLHVVKSKDNGETWSQPQDITSQVAPEGWKKDFKFITSGRAVQTRKGWILNTLVRLNDGVYIIGTKNHGKTWFRLPAVAATADETNIVELPNRDWMLNARVKNLGYRKIFISKNKGKTWKEYTDKQLIDPTCNASTLVVDKNLWFSNLHDQKNRENLGIKMSPDLGKTWNFIKTIEPGSTAYSVLVPVSKNELGVIYEADDYKDIVFETFSTK